MTTSKREGVRGSSSRQQQIVSKRKVFYDVTEGLKSIETVKHYKWHFEAFMKYVVRTLKYSTITPEKLLEFERGELERLIIAYLKYLYNERHLKASTINSALASVVHFCDMNDVLLNRRKIGKLCIPAEEDQKEDRAYTRKEIGRLLKESDQRFRVVFLLLSSGMRIGAIHQLQIGDLTPISISDSEGGGGVQQQKIYKIMVYGRSKKGRYYTFVTPEVSQAIDEYLAFRNKNAHEDITKGTSPLIREHFSLYNQPRSRSGLGIDIPKRVTQGAIEKSIERIVKKAGLGTTDQVLLTHGFRKWAVTQMKKAKVDFSDREYLVGHRHSRGLDVNYDRTSEEERLVEWSKAINNLTINPIYHIQKQLELIEGEQSQKIALLEQEKIRMRKEFAEYKAFQSEQMDQIRKELLDREDRHVQTMVKADEKYDTLLKEYKKKD